MTNKMIARYKAMTAPKKRVRKLEYCETCKRIVRSLARHERRHHKPTN